MNLETRPANINRREVLRNGKSGVNIEKLTHIMPQDFSDFAHLCV